MIGSSPRGALAARLIGSAEGRPCVTRLSISHAGGWAVAAVADAPLGIDLIAIEEVGLAFADEAFAPGELEGARLAFAGLGDEPVMDCLAFAAKEAALK
jgi:4'-phosphopantetheinyl transferase EntD